MLTGIITVSIALFILGSFMIFKEWKKSNHNNVSSQEEVKTAMVGNDGLKKNSTGVVEMEGRKYTAILAMGASKDKLDKGEEVEVTGFDGKFLIVKPLPNR